MFDAERGEQGEESIGRWAERGERRTERRADRKSKERRAAAGGAI